MKLQGKKIAVLIEGDFYEKEIFYYEHRFPEEGVELHFLTRLWGQPSLTFYGHEYKVPFECHESFENIDDATLRSYAAIIVPSAIVSDRLRYTEDINKLPPSRASSATACGSWPRCRNWSGAGEWLPITTCSATSRTWAPSTQTKMSSLMATS